MSNSQDGSKPNGITSQPLPAPHKVYIQSSHRADVHVPMRAITLSNSHGGINGNGHGESANAPVMVYDTSGPYTDPDAQTDIRQGLKPLRLDWIRSRGDTEELSAPSYQPPAGKNGRKNASATERFPDAARRPILRAKPGCNVSQMHYARKGIVTPEMAYIAIRENQALKLARQNGQKNGNARLAQQHPGNSWG